MRNNIKKRSSLLNDVKNNFSHTPASEETIKSLPLFSNQALPISAADLHSSYLPNFKVIDRPFTDFTGNLLKHISINTLGDLLLYPGTKLLQIKNLGPNRLNTLKKLVYNFIIFILQNNEIYSKNATVNCLHRFPFYSGIKQPYINLP